MPNKGAIRDEFLKVSLKELNSLRESINRVIGEHGSMQVNPAATAYDLIALANNIVRKLYEAIEDEDEYSMAVRIINEELNENLTALSKNVGLRH
jgi:hypothetical protein